MNAPKVLVFAGSARVNALSKRLARVAARALTDAGAAVTLIDLADYPQPLYNADLEAADGLPASIVELQRLFATHDALLIATPEYNGSVPPLVKNTLDWCSRTNPADPAASGLAVYANKPAAIVSSSPGALGGLRSLFHLRDMLGYLGMLVLPQQLAVGQGADAFESSGDALKDARQQKALGTLAGALVNAARRLGGPHAAP